MKRSKNVFAVALVLIVALLATACSGNENTKEEKEETTQSSLPGAIFMPERDITLRVADSAEAVSSGYSEKLARAFEEEYKEYNIKVEVLTIGYDYQLELEAPAGKAPDVMEQASDKGRWYAGQLIMPVDPALIAYTDNQDIPRWAFDAFRYEGTNFGYPMYLQTSILMYRKSMIPEEWKNEEGELAITTWNDMYAMNKRIKDGAYTDSSLSHGIMFHAGNVYNTYGLLAAYGGYIFGEENTDVSDVGFGAGEAYKGARVIRDISETMYDTHITWEVANQIPSEIAQGNFLGTISTPNQITTIANQLVQNTSFATEEEALEDIGYMVLPNLPINGNIKEEVAIEDTIPCPAMGGIQGYLVNSYTRYPNAARLYAAFAATSENMLERSVKVNLTPVRKSLYEDMTKGSKVTFEQSQEKRFLMMPTKSELSQMWGPAQAAIEKLVDDHHDDSIDFSADEDIQGLLDKLSQDIEDAISILE